MRVKRITAGALALLQLIWSFSPGAYEALAQNVVETGGPGTAIPVVPIQVVGGPQPGIASDPILDTSLLPFPTLDTPVLRHGLSTTPRPVPRVIVEIQNRVPVRLETVSKQVEQALSLPGLSRDAPDEKSQEAATKVFSALHGERPASGTGEIATRIGPTLSHNLRATLFQKPLDRAALQRTIVLQPAVENQTRPKMPLLRHPAVRAVAAVAAAAALVAAAAFLPVPVAAVAATGSVLLGLIGIPQIARNFAMGRKGVGDLTIASPLIWFAAAVLLSVVSVGQGASLWWNVVNLAGVAESAAVVGQINYYKRDPAALKATLLTAAALTPLLLVAAQALLPLSAWLTVAFTAAMALLWVLNWPQIRRNYRIYRAEGRPPTGIAPLYPALVAVGSLLHLYAAILGGDWRWALNAVVAILTTGLVLAQIYLPRPTNAAVGPAVRLIERLLPAKMDLREEARGAVSGLFPALSRLKPAGTDHARLPEVLERARALPGRSVVFLQATTAAGKSTLAAELSRTFAGRWRVFPVDRYFKARSHIPISVDGQPDFDRPESLDLDRVARDIRTLLAGGKVELPLHDMATETTRYDSGEFLELGADEILVVDSIYASHERLLAAAQGRPTLNIFLYAPASVRLARRLRRDRIERHIPAETTLRRWPVILRDEKEFILPLRDKADFVLQLVGEEELRALPETYAEILAGEWSRSGKDPVLTKLLIDAVAESLQADGT